MVQTHKSSGAVPARGITRRMKGSYKDSPWRGVMGFYTVPSILAHSPEKHSRRAISKGDAPAPGWAAGRTQTWWVQGPALSFDLDTGVGWEPTGRCLAPP